MSDETQGNPLFSQFVPAKETTMPFTPAPDEAPTRQLKKRAKLVEQQAAKAAKLPRAKRKPKPPKQPTAPEQVARPKALAFDLQTILRATAGLKEEDYPAFEPLLNQFREWPKPQCARLLTALGKVFA